MTPMIWLIVALALLLIEVLTPGLFFFGCLAAGALLAALGAWLGLHPWATWAVFFISSTILVLVVAPIARRYMKRLPTSPVGLDSLKGQRAYVVDGIDPATGQGQVRLETGALWRASAESAIAKETWVEVLDVKGTRLVVKSI